MPPASCSNWARCSKVSRSEKGAGRLSAMLPPAYAVLRLRPTAGRLSRGARPSFRSLLFSACGQPRLECLRTADHSISMSDSWFEPDPIRSAIYRLPAIGNFLLWFRYWFGCRAAGPSTMDGAEKLGRHDMSLTSNLSRNDPVRSQGYHLLTGSA